MHLIYNIKCANTVVLICTFEVKNLLLLILNILLFSDFRLIVVKYTANNDQFCKPIICILFYMLQIMEGWEGESIEKTIMLLRRDKIEIAVLAVIIRNLLERKI